MAGAHLQAWPGAALWHGCLWYALPSHACGLVVSYLSAWERMHRLACHPLRQRAGAGILEEACCCGWRRVSEARLLISASCPQPLCKVETGVLMWALPGVCSAGVSDFNRNLDTDEAADCMVKLLNSNVISVKSQVLHFIFYLFSVILYSS